MKYKTIGIIIIIMAVVLVLVVNALNTYENSNYTLEDENEDENHYFGSIIEKIDNPIVQQSIYLNNTKSLKKS